MVFGVLIVVFEGGLRDWKIFECKFIVLLRFGVGIVFFEVDDKELKEVFVFVEEFRWLGFFFVRVIKDVVDLVLCWNGIFFDEWMLGSFV